MSRITSVVETIGLAPSHSPPDMHYAPTIDLARCLGWFSVALGVTELLRPRLISRMSGVEHTSLIGAYGLREIATGIGILTSAQPKAWMWSRVAGDALDLATLGEAMAHGDAEQRRAAIGAAIAVAGVMSLDLASSIALTAADRVEG